MIDKIAEINGYKIHSGDRIKGNFFDKALNQICEFSGIFLYYENRDMQLCTIPMLHYYSDQTGKAEWVNLNHIGDLSVKLVA